jgi:hypothetical protein
MHEKFTWKITPTVTSERVNLFCIGAGHQHHVATIISGSRRNLPRFDQSIALIEAAPHMEELLEETLAMLNDFGFLQSPTAQQLEKRISQLLDTLDGHHSSEKVSSS